MFLSPPEISLVGLAIGKFENSLPMLEVVQPTTFVCIPILVPVESLAALVVSKLPPKNIPVEEGELALHLVVPVPISLEDRTLAKIVGPFALPLPLLESAPVAILVDELKGA